ncbi:MULTISPECIES: aldose 1-epimerase family protein [Methylosinus]|uniref:Aldose epimerase n=1 Tax=Methylosinus trichosporium (strain ATCC 35070 / NCIMB 11131 / UNIQEM 75 / OB3b) TaxID=595536 RepID=A0A2D2CV87_METT3|nr:MULTISPECIES: aldose 1-epimerase family protein [Methylosinus]ATQ66615.1 aldose epimerase [Methylosinus trichosporium OB3b]OBS51694.1 aldose epimerase [Methylosinus sp. 3S-1]
MSEPILLRAGDDDDAAVSPLGAQLSSWRARGAELLWSPDAAVWSETAPLLFPVVGWTRNGRARVGDREFPLGLHGFARHKRFALAERSETSARFVLDADAETLALYPFAFRLEARYALRPGELEVALRAINRDERPLPYAAGLHPGFRWPLAGSRAPHMIRFERAERPEVPVIAPGGLFSARRRPVPLDGAALPLTRELLAEEALCFLDAASRRLAYDNGAGANLCIELDDFPHIALWSRPPSPFLCIEAWTGHGDPEDFCGDLYEKPSMRILRPGESATHRATFRLRSEAE